MTEKPRPEHSVLDAVWPDVRFPDGASPIELATLRDRVERHWPDLYRLLHRLYGDRDDFKEHLVDLLTLAAARWMERPPDLRALDVRREADPNWFQSERMVGGVLYVDRFAGTLQTLRARIPYFRTLGLTYLHLMPPYLAPSGNNDGGYAVSSYREINPNLGTMAELRELASELRSNGISLVLDFVFNHTSDEHPWAQRALKGESEAQGYFYAFSDHTEVEAYQSTLRDIFPDVRPGSFTYYPEIDRWVWTTFNSFQWDLNYRNPTVFIRMADDLLFLANQGAEILRLDALAFIWKQAGTASESLAEAHLLVQAFNAVARIAAPAVLFKSEAIVHPDEVLRYISAGECRLSYNPMLMALLWEALATRDTRLLRTSLQARFTLPAEAAWVNYVRSHDDIGWTFDDTVAARWGINGAAHRQFLNDFYTGRFPNSFARGLPFGENPRTGDARISGTCASLAGLERALDLGDAAEIEQSLDRILLLHGIILSVGGIPLLYLGDEIGTLNDYTFREEPEQAGDSRWVHRPVTDWNEDLNRPRSRAVGRQLQDRLLHLIRTRQATPAFAGNQTQFLDAGNPHLFAYERRHQGERALVLSNFSERSQSLPGGWLAHFAPAPRLRDLVDGREFVAREQPILGPYALLWLIPAIHEPVTIESRP